MSNVARLAGVLFGMHSPGLSRVHFSERWPAGKESHTAAYPAFHGALAQTQIPGLVFLPLSQGLVSSLFLSHSLSQAAAYLHRHSKTKPQIAVTSTELTGPQLSQRLM